MAVLSSQPAFEAEMSHVLLAAENLNVCLCEARLPFRHDKPPWLMASLGTREQTQCLVGKADEVSDLTTQNEPQCLPDGPGPGPRPQGPLVSPFP